MTEETPQREADDAGPLGGERLRAARRANDISIRDIAKELHLDEYKVRAMEKNEFDVLGAPVFAKGHLRKYAELVGVAIDDIMADYYKMNRATGAPPVVSERKPPMQDYAIGRWIGIAFAVLLVVAVLAGAWWWFVLRPAVVPPRITPATPQPEVLTPAPEAADTIDIGEPGLAGADSIDEPGEEDQPPAQEMLPAPVPVETEAAAPEPAMPVAAGQTALSLRYSAECWTEISDATGRRLFYDLGRPGRVVNLAGVAPFRVVLGDAGAVRITVDGRDFPIPGADQGSRLTRLTIEP